MMLLGIAECSCHVWVVSTVNRLGRCGRCGERPVMRGMATEEAKTVCKHEGECR